MSEVMIREAHLLVFSCTECVVNAPVTEMYITAEEQLVFVVECSECHSVETFVASTEQLLTLTRKRDENICDDEVVN